MTSSLPRPALVIGQFTEIFGVVFGVVFGTVLGVGLVVVLVAGLNIALFSDPVKNMGIYLYRRGLNKSCFKFFFISSRTIFWDVSTNLKHQEILSQNILPKYPSKTFTRR